MAVVAAPVKHFLIDFFSKQTDVFLTVCADHACVCRQDAEQGEDAQQDLDLPEEMNLDGLDGDQGKEGDDAEQPDSGPQEPDAPIQNFPEEKTGPGDEEAAEPEVGFAHLVLPNSTVHYQNAFDRLSGPSCA